MGDQLGECDILLISNDSEIGHRPEISVSSGRNPSFDCDLRARKSHLWFRLWAGVSVVLQPDLWRNSVPAAKCMVERTLVRVTKHVRKIDDRQIAFN